MFDALDILKEKLEDAISLLEGISTVTIDDLETIQEICDLMDEFKDIAESIEEE